MRPDNDPLAMLARATFLVMIATITCASLAPAGWIPHVLYSYHLEHFAAFYLVSLSMAAARYRTSINRMLLDVVGLATVLEAIRLFIPSHQLSVVEDYASDIGGALAALAPIIIGDFRKSFAPRAAVEAPTAS